MLDAPTLQERLEAKHKAWAQITIGEPDPLLLEAKDRITTLEAETLEDARTIQHLSGGFELQALMARNNELIARIDALTAERDAVFATTREMAADLAREVYMRLIGFETPYCPCGNGRVPVGAYEIATESFAAAIRALTPPAGMAPVQGWREIATAPRDGTWLLLFWPAIGGDSEVGLKPALNVTGVGVWKKPADGLVEHWCHEGSWTPGDDPTHWQPLPAPPEPGAASDG